jgi:hypothetical protein
MCKRTLVLAGIAFFLMLFLSCSKSKGCYYDSIPNSLILILKKNGQAVPDSILRNTKLFYLINDSSKFVTDFSTATDSIYFNMGFILTRTIGFLSGDENIKTYYLEYPNNWNTDTLFVDYTEPSLATDCAYILHPVKFNNQLAPVDTSFHFDSPVYILNKQ